VTGRGEPRIVAFLCEACAYAAADDAGRGRHGYPHAALTVRVVCSSRVEPALVLQALREGADGVLVGGCHPGDCKYVDGNLRTEARMTLLARALAQAGVEPARVRVEWIGASEGEKFARVVGEMAAALRALPPGRPEAPRPSAGAPEPAPRPPGKPRIAFYWNASCGGCEEAVLDLAEALPAIAARAEIVLWPVAIDAKRAAVEALPDGAIDVAFVNGALRVDEQEDWARLLRRKARRLVAMGACAHLGGIVGLGDLDGPEAILEAAFGPGVRALSNPGAPPPGRHGEPLALPALTDRTRPLAAIVPVDAIIPGCPPSPAILGKAIEALLSADPPGGGAVLAPEAALCESCPLKESRPERPELTRLRRVATEAPDPGKCFLAQGFACSGPATRAGCQPGCLEVGMPCRGCFGPVPGVADGGAAMLATLGSLLVGGTRERRALAEALPDPAGTFWRYGWAAGMPARPKRGGA
jgi:F420-non-reducing hydrogenase small subunit